MKKQIATMKLIKGKDIAKDRAYIDSVIKEQWPFVTVIKFLPETQASDAMMRSDRIQIWFNTSNKVINFTKG